MRHKGNQASRTSEDPQFKVRTTREFVNVELPRLMEVSNSSTYQDFFGKALDLYSEVVATLVLNPSYRLVFADDEGVTQKEFVIPGLRRAAGRLARGASDGFWQQETMTGPQSGSEPATGGALARIASPARGTKV